MKADTYIQIKTLVPIFADGINFPEGTLGAIVETYSNPEGYAVDLAIPDHQLIGGFRYHNVILNHKQFAIMENTHQDEVQALSNILDILEVYCRHTLVENKFFTNPRTIKNLTFVKTQQRDLLKRFIFFGLSFFFLFLVFGILFRISGSNLIQIIAAFFWLLLVVSAIYFPYSFLFSAWRNTKSKKQNIRNKFLQFKQE